MVVTLWELRDSNPRPSACKADAINIPLSQSLSSYQSRKTRGKILPFPLFPPFKNVVLLLFL